MRHPPQCRSSIDTYRTPPLLEPLFLQTPAAPSRPSRRTLPDFTYPFPSFRLCRIKLQSRAQKGLAELEETLFGGIREEGSGSAPSSTAVDGEEVDADVSLLTDEPDEAAIPRSSSQPSRDCQLVQEDEDGLAKHFKCLNKHRKGQPQQRRFQYPPMAASALEPSPSLLHQWHVYANARMLAEKDDAHRDAAAPVARRASHKRRTPRTPSPDLPTLVEESLSASPAKTPAQGGEGAETPLNAPESDLTRDHACVKELKEPTVHIEVPNLPPTSHRDIEEDLESESKHENLGARGDPPCPRQRSAMYRLPWSTSAPSTLSAISISSIRPAEAFVDPLVVFSEPNAWLQRLRIQAQHRREQEAEKERWKKEVKARASPPTAGAESQGSIPFAFGPCSEWKAPKTQDHLSRRSISMPTSPCGMSADSDDGSSCTGTGTDVSTPSKSPGPRWGQDQMTSAL